MTHKCQRMYPDDRGVLFFPPGVSCYGKDEYNVWLFKHKDANFSALFSAEDVIEHEDGTITIKPLIIDDHAKGYLEDGEWRNIE